MTAQRTGAPRTARRLQAVAAALAVASAGLVSVSGYPDTGRAAAAAEACETALPDSFWRAPVDTLPVHRDFAR